MLVTTTKGQYVKTIKKSRPLKHYRCQEPGCGECFKLIHI